jgi:enoyl-CoA hydratase
MQSHVTRYEALAIETPEPHILVVRINRPEVANASNTQTGHDIYAVWTALTHDPGEIRCAVFTAPATERSALAAASRSAAA